MKQLAIYGIQLLVVALSVPNLLGQGVLITDDGTTSPESSARLEMKSSTQGFLPPRMDVNQMEAISTPLAGMIVYNTSQQIPMVYNGTEWASLSGATLYESLEVGDYYQGGIIFYLDGSGGGLISATDDQGIADWGCQGSVITSGNGADSDDDGAANTQAILTDCSDPGIAAKICDDYEVTDNGVTFDDWYLPALNELLLLYSERVMVGNFQTTGGVRYYTSTETSISQAKRVNFSTGASENNNKDGTERSVRPIRAF